MKKVIGLGLGLLFFCPGAYALDLGVGGRVGINGIGAEISVGLTQRLNLRFMAASIDIDDEEETVTVGDAGFEGDILAEVGFDYGATALFLDWHVFNGSFRLTAGMMRNDGGADVSGSLQSPIVVDGVTISPSDFEGNTLSGSVDLADSYQPYLGIGWGRGAGDGPGLSLMFDVGVALLDPAVTLDATLASGSGLTQAEFDDALRGMEEDAEADLDDLEIWPVLAVGLNFRF